MGKIKVINLKSALNRMLPQVKSNSKPVLIKQLESLLERVIDRINTNYYNICERIHAYRKDVEHLSVQLSELDDILHDVDIEVSHIRNKVEDAIDILYEETNENNN